MYNIEKYTFTVHFNKNTFILLMYVVWTNVAVEPVDALSGQIMHHLKSSCYCLHQTSEQRKSVISVKL